MGLRLCQFHPDIAVKLVIRAFISAGEVAKNLNVLMVSVVGMVMSRENASYVLSAIGGVVSLLRGSDSLACPINPGLLQHLDVEARRKPRSFNAG